MRTLIFKLEKKEGGKKKKKKKEALNTDPAVGL